MLEAGVGEPLAIVDLLVQPHDASDIVQPEIREVGFWGVERISILNLAVWMRSAERKELARDKPVEITVLNLFIVLVLVIVKIIKVEKS